MWALLDAIATRQSAEAVASSLERLVESTPPPVLLTSSTGGSAS